MERLKSLQHQFDSSEEIDDREQYGSLCVKKYREKWDTVTH